MPFLRAYETLQYEFKNTTWRADAGLSEMPEGRTPYVKVALIDTGVDPNSIRCSRVTGASFVPPEAGEYPWWVSQNPHGTQMAKIITELDPYCHLLVAKMSDTGMDIMQSRFIEVRKSMIPCTPILPPSWEKRGEALSRRCGAIAKM